ncbi:hypothetical protein CCHR01_19441 [Colletotrichum chrysophilum]|uniref:Uncharacterized protein n=1 Tax=Colletotrichum chrysophilum TaxID=1836956 RepID=A0AAD9A0J7_9PEZI|nr:hypothetical protein CCHR01_19441 [Colletotrichum chrysophilum]
MKGTIEDTNVLQRQERTLQLVDGGFSQKSKPYSSERAEAISEIFGVDLRN